MKVWGLITAGVIGSIILGYMFTMDDRQSTDTLPPAAPETVQLQREQTGPASQTPAPRQLIREPGGELRKEPADLMQRLSMLETSQQQLQQQLTRLTTQLNQIIAQREPDTAPDLDTAFTETTVSGPVAVQSDLEADPTYPADSDSLTQMTALDDMFFQQTRNSRWADGMEAETGQALSSNDQIGSGLLDLECRNSLCRALIQFDSFDERDIGLEVIPTLLDFAGEVSVVPMDDAPEVTVYIGE